MGRERRVALRARKESIQFVFYWRGKQRFESLKIAPSTRNMKAAEVMAENIRQDIERDCFDLGEHFPDSPNVNLSSSGRPKTLTGLADRWIKQLEKSDNTIRKYKSALKNYWYPEFGDRDFRYIYGTEIQEIVAETHWTSVSVRNNALTPMRQMFKYAIRQKWIRVDPLEDIAHIKPQKEPPDPLEPEEAAKVLDWIAENEPHWLPYFGFRLLSGPRPGEVHALLPDDIRWSLEIVKINKTMTRKGVKETKTSESRETELNRESARYLKLAIESMNPDQQTVFAHKSGETIRSGKMPRLVWNAALKALEIRHRSSYHTRHTCITMNIMAGANIFWLAGQVGTSVALIEKTYATWIRKAAKDSESKKLTKYWKGKKKR